MKDLEILFLSTVMFRLSIVILLLQEELDSSDQPAKGQKTALEAVVGEAFWAIMQNMIFDSVFEVDSVLENESDFFDSCRLHFEQKNLK